MVEQRSPKPRAEGSSPSAPAIFEKLKLRGVAQFGSATGLGPVGRGFKSCHPDHFLKFYIQRGVAQFGSATGLGPVGRGFKSCHPDHFPSFGPLAQRLEQPAHNRSVLGSTPRWPTTFAQIAQLVEQETENLRVPGSIPGLGTTHDPDVNSGSFFLYRPKKGPNCRHKGSTASGPPCVKCECTVGKMS